MWKILEKTAVFSGRIWPDWGNTARANMAGLGSIGLGYTFMCVSIITYKGMQG